MFFFKDLYVHIVPILAVLYILLCENFMKFTDILLKIGLDLTAQIL